MDGSSRSTRARHPPRHRTRRTLDLAGRTVLPGLIDAHVHLSSYDHLPPLLRGEAPRPAELRVFVLANMARAFLRAGITTVRDVGSYDNEAIVLRSAHELGLVDGPRLLSCGRILTATSPGARIFGTMYREADGPWEMRKAVREQIRDGADYIKIMATGARSVEREDPEPAQMTLEEVAAVVEEAHRMGYRVAAHAEGLASAPTRSMPAWTPSTWPFAPSGARAARRHGRMASSSFRPCPPSTTWRNASPRTSPHASSSRPSGSRGRGADRRRGTNRRRDARDGLRQWAAGGQRRRARADGRRRAPRCRRGPRRHRWRSASALGLTDVGTVPAEDRRPPRRRRRPAPRSGRGS